MEPAQPLKLMVLMPVYDDWQCARLVIEKLDSVLNDIGAAVSIMLIDDGSRKEPPVLFVDAPLKNISRIERLRLRRNLGHQRAIAIGLCFVYWNRACEAVLIMDADGEDKPEDVQILIERYKKLEGSSVVFAERTRRSESVVFRFFYQTYRVLHRALTGIPVKVGNFSILSRDHLAGLSVVSDLWNHYAASVFKARLQTALVPTSRGQRLVGKSRLNFVGLVVHGLSAISVLLKQSVYG